MGAEGSQIAASNGSINTIGNAMLNFNDKIKFNKDDLNTNIPIEKISYFIVLI